MAYPYVARRWLAGDTSEMREKPLEMENHSTSPNLLQVAGARLKLLLLTLKWRTFSPRK
jgi:hypothetical protein